MQLKSKKNNKKQSNLSFLSIFFLIPLTFFFPHFLSICFLSFFLQMLSFFFLHTQDFFLYMLFSPQTFLFSPPTFSILFLSILIFHILSSFSTHFLSLSLSLSFFLSLFIYFFILEKVSPWHNILSAGLQPQRKRVWTPVVLLRSLLDKYSW